MSDKVWKTGGKEGGLTHTSSVNLSVWLMSCHGTKETIYNNPISQIKTERKSKTAERYNLMNEKTDKSAFSVFFFFNQSSGIKIN